MLGAKLSSIRGGGVGEDCVLGLMSYSRNVVTIAVRWDWKNQDIATPITHYLPLSEFSISAKTGGFRDSFVVLSTILLEDFHFGFLQY